LNGLCGDVAEARSRLKRYLRPSWSVAEETFDLKSAPAYVDGSHSRSPQNTFTSCIIQTKIWRKRISINTVGTSQSLTLFLRPI